jgi:hypothetical protein
MSERSAEAWLTQEKALLTDQIMQVRSFELLQNLLVDTSRIGLLFWVFLFNSVQRAAVGWIPPADPGQVNGCPGIERTAIC